MPYPYQNQPQMYANPYQQMQYSQPSLPQQYQQSYQQPQTLMQKPVTGRFVTTPTEIQANEVPMDGRIGFFPTNDMQTIYAKQWRSDGSIQTVKYIPETAPIEENKPDILQEIMAKLNSIEEKLGSSKKTKKEEQKNEHE